MENYPDVEEPKKKGFTVGKLFKWAAIAVIAAVYVILIARCTMYRDDKIVSEILTDDTTLAAYQADPENFAVEQYGMSSPWIAIEDGRMVQFNFLYHIKAARQLQFSVKYNVDLIPYTPGQGELPMRFRLVDEDGTVYEDYFWKQKQRFRYNYIRVCFNGIDLENADKPLKENGKPERHTYMLYIDCLSEDGSYTELCKYSIYDGSEVSKMITDTLK